MSFFKIDLQEDAWLDQIFLSRNQAYGAFQIRKAYPNSSLYGLGITLLVFGAMVSIPIFLRTPKINLPVIVPEGPSILTQIPIYDPPKPPSLPKTKIIPISRPSIKETVPVITANPVPPKDIPPSTQQTAITDIGNASRIGKDSSSKYNTTVNPDPVEGTKGSNDPLRIVENPAEYPGGLKAISEEVSKYLSNHYPQQALEEGKGGKVLLQFIVERNGEISNITIIQGDKIGAGIPEVAVKAIQQLNRFKPGMQNGHTVRQYFLFPITFQVQDRDN